MVLFDLINEEKRRCCHTAFANKSVCLCVQTERFMQQLAEFAGHHGMSAGPLKTLMKSVLLVPQGGRNTHSLRVRRGGGLMSK